jgi:hypothetical protein
MKTAAPTFDDLQLELRVIVYREDAFWLAHCLELDIVAEGETPQKAVRDLTDLCVLQIRTAIEESDLTSIFRPAPAEIWKLFFTSKKKKKTKLAPGGPIAQIDEHELELV